MYDSLSVEIIHQREGVFDDFDAVSEITRLATADNSFN
jgi:hypothetical protein